MLIVRDFFHREKLNVANTQLVRLFEARARHGRRSGIQIFLPVRKLIPVYVSC